MMAKKNKGLERDARVGVVAADFPGLAHHGVDRDGLAGGLTDFVRCIAHHTVMGTAVERHLAVFDVEHLAQREDALADETPSAWDCT